MSDDLKQWSKLLQAIAKGVVIPIVGRDLLRIEVDGRQQLLYEYLAAQLAAQLEVECDPSASIDQVVAAYLNASRRNSRNDVNLKAFEILTHIGAAEGHLPVPEPLRKLGAIQPLRLFLSTTVDSLLANALGSPADHVFAYSPNSTLVSATPTLTGSRGSLSDWLAATASTVATKRANLSPTEQLLRTSTCTTFWKISARRPSRLAWPIPSSSWTSSQRNGTPSRTSPRLPDRELLQSLLPPSLPRFSSATPARTARLSSGCRPASVSWAWMSGLTKGASSPAIPGGRSSSRTSPPATFSSP